MNISFVVELSRSELVPAAEPADANGKGIWNK